MAERNKMMDDKADDGLAVAPPPPGGAEGEREAQDDADAQNRVRPAMDADDIQDLASDPSDEDAKLDIALDETFPTSDPPSNTQPGKGKDPAPSSGFDEGEEASRMGGRE